VFAMQLAALAECTRRLERRLVGAGSATARLLSAAVLAAAQAIGIGLLLGYLGRLGTVQIVLGEGALLLALWMLDRRLPVSGTAPLAGTVVRAVHTLSPRERRLGAALAFAVGMVALTGVLGERLSHDALSYRLSRIGYWLQEGSVRHFPTNELRQSYSPIDADLLMLWLTHPFRSGYPLVTLAQAWGGAMLMLATWMLARASGLGRGAALGAVTLAVGAPCVLVQFGTSQNDLVTAGLATAALALGQASLDDRRLILPAWLALSLALGAKSTALFLLPGFAAFALSVAVQRRLGRSRLALHAGAAVACLALFALPRYAENQAAWGDPFAPRAFYAAHRGPVSFATVLPKMELNLATYAAQTLDPHSNPAVLERWLRPAWKRLVAALPEGDPYTGPVYPRRSSLRFFADLPLCTADTLFLGLALPALATIGAVVSVRRRREARASLSPAWLAAVAALFVVGLGVAFQWWPTNGRFFSLVAAPLGVLAACALAALPPTGRLLGWVVAASLVAAAGFEVYFGSTNSGWRTLPGRPPPDLAYWVDHLSEERLVRALPPASRLGVALPGYSVLAGLFRGGSDVRVRFVPLQLLRTENTASTVLSSEGLDALLTRPPIRAGNARMLLLRGGTGSFALYLARPSEAFRPR
jgi:hypothetical protein